MNAELVTLSAALGQTLLERGLTLATAESCTGGLIGCSLTDVPGSSRWYLGGVVAYANSVKQALLDVPEEELLRHGAVSRQVALSMARGAAARLGASCAVAVSGIAGPDGGTPDKPVGTVWVAWRLPEGVDAQIFHFQGDRLAVKRQSAAAAILGLTSRLG